MTDSPSRFFSSLGNTFCSYIFDHLPDALAEKVRIFVNFSTSYRGLTVHADFLGLFLSQAASRVGALGEFSPRDSVVTCYLLSVGTAPQSNRPDRLLLHFRRSVHF
jgi:hypothetical protein